METVNTAETWKPIPGIFGIYDVSNMGAIRKRVGKKLRIVRCADNGNGYLYFTATHDGKRRNVYVHRAVASAFLENPMNYGYVNHIDYDKRNNSVVNLEWCTQRDNILHSSGRMHHPRKSAQTKTGHKYITERSYIHGVKYRVVAKFGDKTFHTLREAIEWRNAKLNINYDFHGHRLEPDQVAEQCVECGNCTVAHHHIFGAANRRISEKYDYVIPLCPEHHAQLHAHPNSGIDIKWKQTAQKDFETFYGGREQFIKTFGRSYL